MTDSFNHTRKIPPCWIYLKQSLSLASGDNGLPEPKMKFAVTRTGMISLVQ